MPARQLITAAEWIANPTLRHDYPASVRAEWIARATVESTRYQTTRAALEALTELWEDAEDWNQPTEGGSIGAQLKKRANQYPALYAHLPHLTSYDDVVGHIHTMEAMRAEASAAMFAASAEADRWDPIVNPDDYE